MFILRHLFLCFTIFSFLFGTVHPAASGEIEQKRIPYITIADSKGDWGPPAPYLHNQKGPGYMFTSFLFDTLLWRDEKGNLVPSLASSWKVQNEGTSFLFTIHPEARWHDGKKVTPEDVVFTVEYFKRHPYAFANTSSIAKAAVEGKNEVRITFEKPYAPFLSSVAAAMPVLPKHIYEHVSDPSRFSDPLAFTGSGPFILKKYDGAQKIYQFKANHNYHRGTPWVEELRILGLKPAAAAAAALRGEVDVLTNVQPQQSEKLEKQGFSILRYSLVHPVRLKFNLAYTLFQNAKVRHAFAQAIDKKEIVAKAYGGEAEIWSAGGLCSLEQESAEAKIPQYGYAPHSLKDIQLPEETLKLLVDDRTVKAGKVVAAQLERQGAKVELILGERGATKRFLKKGEYHLALVTFSVLGDPLIFKDAEIGSRVDGDHYHDNPELTELLMTQVEETDPEAREALLKKASRLYAQDLPSYSMISPVKTVAFNDRVRLYFSPRGLGSGIPTVLDRNVFLPSGK